MERCAIIIHSVNGNCYIIATYLQELLVKRNVDARLYRVEDSDLHI
ncbi:MAG: flavodoxin family protein, partial [Spirochaetales bacterium]|nr:flavodoxin family protein [Spirochaetales bacterium]